MTRAERRLAKAQRKYEKSVERAKVRAKVWQLAFGEPNGATSSRLVVWLTDLFRRHKVLIPIGVLLAFGIAIGLIAITGMRVSAPTMSGSSVSSVAASSSTVAASEVPSAVMVEPGSAGQAPTDSQAAAADELTIKGNQWTPETSDGVIGFVSTSDPGYFAGAVARASAEWSTQTPSSTWVQSMTTWFAPDSVAPKVSTPEPHLSNQWVSAANDWAQKAQSLGAARFVAQVQSMTLNDQTGTGFPIGDKVSGGSGSYLARVSVSQQALIPGQDPVTNFVTVDVAFVCAPWPGQTECRAVYVSGGGKGLYSDTFTSWLVTHE